jgi:hypothetical protein
MLARQWQVGEFAGEDAGSPIDATLGVLNRSVTAYQPGSDAAATVALDATLPLETHVEREPVVLKLRASVQLGLWFERRLRAAGVASATRDEFRSTYPLPAATPDAAVYDGPDGPMFRALATGRVADGLAIVQAAAGVAGAPPLPSVATTDPAVATAVAALTAYRQSLYSEPQNDRAWQPQELAYDFSLRSPLSSTDNLALSADGFGGGHLDWYDFQAAQSQDALPAVPAATSTAVSFAFLPQHITFRGMPDPRWWTFESGVTDFGSLDTETVDLAKLLVMEFALTYGNDWFIVPVPTAVGSLSAITSLVVTDTFGQRTLIRSSEQTVVPGESPWSMFKLSGDGTRSAFIFVAPTLGVTDEGVDLENVHFLRDDMAAMAWAVEHALHGTLDSPVDAYQSYLARIAANPLPKPTPQPDDPPIYYTLESVVPDNWIPLVPVQTAAGQLVFRRGILERPEGAGFVGNPAHASVLEPGVPFYLTDRIITRIGTFASVSFRRSRGVDGTAYVWQARRSRPGSGPGWSGLRFDYLQRFDGTAANP